MIGVSAFVACSVYDESLRRGENSAQVGGAAGADGGASSAAAGTVAGGGAGHAAGGDQLDAGAPGAAGDAGEPATAGTTGGGGAANGGTAGVASPGGTGGVPASGGNGGATAGAGGGGIELAVAKPTTASTQQPANPSTSGNDGQIGTRWSATTGTLPQWWRVDLGDNHVLSQVSVQFENADRKYTYLVETSSNDTAYTTQASVDSGVGQVQTVQLPGNVSARYVRITVTATVPGVDPTTGASRPTWASFGEVSVLGT